MGGFVRGTAAGLLAGATLSAGLVAAGVAYRRTEAIIALVGDSPVLANVIVGPDCPQAAVCMPGSGGLVTGSILGAVPGREFTVYSGPDSNVVLGGIVR